MKAILTITLALLATNLIAYNLKMKPLDSNLLVGFTPGAPLEQGKPGQMRIDKNHSINDFTQLQVKSIRYQAANNIGGISVDQKAEKATVQCQQAAWGEKYTIKVFYNNAPVGQCISDGNKSININNFSNNSTVELDIKGNNNAK